VAVPPDGQHARLAGGGRLRPEVRDLDHGREDAVDPGIRLRRIGALSSLEPRVPDVPPRCGPRVPGISPRPQSRVPSDPPGLESRVSSGPAGFQSRFPDDPDPDGDPLVGPVSDGGFPVDLVRC
jgi:hypothetical protein